MVRGRKETGLFEKSLETAQGSPLLDRQGERQGKLESRSGKTLKGRKRYAAYSRFLHPQWTYCCNGKAVMC